MDQKEHGGMAKMGAQTGGKPMEPKCKECTKDMDKMMAEMNGGKKG